MTDQKPRVNADMETAQLHLLAAIHDLLDERLPKPLVSRGVEPHTHDPGEDVLPSEHPEPCRCGECLTIENRPGDTSGRIGWLHIDGERYLAREVEGGWADDDREKRAIWPREAFPSAEFTPTLDPATQVVVNRDDLLTYLDASKGWTCAEDRLRAALDGQS